MIVKAKAYIPSRGVFQFECDLANPSNPLKMFDGEQEIATSKTAADCNGSEETFKLLCVSMLADIAGVQCGTWTVD